MDDVTAAKKIKTYLRCVRKQRIRPGLKRLKADFPPIPPLPRTALRTGPREANPAASRMTAKARAVRMVHAAFAMQGRMHLTRGQSAGRAPLRMRMRRRLRTSTATAARTDTLAHDRPRKCRAGRAVPLWRVGSLDGDVRCGRGHGGGCEGWSGGIEAGGRA